MDNREQLHRRLFSEPGCLLELAEMVKARVEKEPASVFNWFLAHEVNSMAALAQARLDDTNKKNASSTADISAHQWSSLRIPPPPLKGKKSTQLYLDIIRKECGYDN